VRSSNPVLSRLTPETRAGSPLPAGYGQGSTAYPQESAVLTATTDRMTVDDVVVKTAGVLALVGVSGGLAWAAADAGILPAGAWIGAVIVGLILGLVIAFQRMANPALVVVYSVVEGVFLGLVSRAFESAFSGIVVQAVLGTFGVFFVMAFLYKSRVIRATPKFVRIVTGAVIGLVVVMLGNLVLSLFDVTTGLRGNGDGSVSWIAIAFSLVCIVVASLTFVLDFAQIEQAVQAGMPKRYAWTCAFGILVGLVWLYLEILRLLSYLRGDD
jgi:uncharacterized YccA/Bax inhibitor family protein